MVGPRALTALAAGLVACATAGAWAGFDAAGQVDRRYTVPRWERLREPPMPASSPWDWNEVPPPAAMPATYEVPSRSERAFFDPGDDLRDVDAAIDRIEPVRVHRAAGRAATEARTLPEAESPEPVPPEAAVLDEAPRSAEDAPAAAEPGDVTPTS